MSSDESTSPGAAGASSTAVGTGRRSSPWTWLLPALTFLVGCLLGGVVVAAGAFDGDDDEPLRAAPGASQQPGDGEDGPQPTPTSGDVVVRVPESCLQAADMATSAIGQIDRVVEAVRDLDARRLQEIVDQVQKLEPEVRRLADQCRSVSGERLQDAVSPTPAASPTS